MITTPSEVIRVIFYGIVIILAGLLIIGVNKARPAEPTKIDVPCPPDAKSCKVIVLTDDQIKSLELFIDNTMIAGPFKQINDAIQFYHKTFDEAPEGTPRK
jgi:hypothetical protein